MTAPLLELEHVGKTFERGARSIVVLRDVSVSVRPGEFAAIWGTRNAGKSTLLKIAAGMERPDNGLVMFSGLDLGALSETKLADIRNRELAWVAAVAPPVSEWAMADYVALPVMYDFKPTAARSRAIDVLDRVGVLDCADARWDDLGNHERTLIALAHAIVREPQFVVMDDPTAGLDAVERSRVLSLVRSLAAEMGFGCLMAVPDMPSMLSATSMYSLSDGELMGEELERPDGDGGDVVVEFPSGGIERSA